MRLGCKEASSFDLGELSQILSSCEVHLKVEFAERSENGAESINSDNLFEEDGQKF